MTDIELVIKIPEEIRLALINNIQLSIDQQSICDSYIKQAIINGIPLPKGHGDLKDQKELAKSLYDYQWIDQQTYIEVTNRLIDTPTIIKEDNGE